ncbi:copper amine oxidase N-terminal domain-containing protein [Aneurinibacillus aneurinilyticus]|uniref:copper amine oxidase N-terminal domain-containing protein n=1 Tax=Aneurinibacillus aneurinilyticus TaxID=1391 RepID=UPI0023F7BA26|nr:copper amine oxidase N-terminal domain-containing protein [Aneurinibacillus aneurinilyticus]MCI1692853.1 copper amine oxidase N-terminal domain-containing protein [Aneurinibacillus aneurinilyticus]
MNHIVKKSTMALLAASLFIAPHTVTYAQSSSPEEVVRIWEGAYGLSVSVDKVHTILAGKKDANFVTTVDIEELVPGTFLPGREITFSLPKGIKSESKINVSHNSDLKIETTTGKITITVPHDRQEQKYRLQATMRLTARVDKKGEMKASIKGDGITAHDILIAKVDPTSRIEAAAKPESVSLLLGKQQQAAPDLLFTEEIKGAFRKEGNADISFYLPHEGMYFSAPPTVDVIQGDLEIDPYSVQVLDNRTGEHENVITFKIKKESTKPSVIRVSNIKITTNRMIADGIYNLTVLGDALSHISLLDDSKSKKFPRVSQFPYVYVNYQNKSEMKRSEISLMPGSLNYYEGKTEKKMSAPSYIKQNRIYVPVDFFIDTLGLHESHVLWSESDRVLTLLKNSTIIQLQMDNNMARLNRVDIPLSAGIEKRDGKIMVPLTDMAALVGMKIKWDAATGRIILNYS